MWLRTESIPWTPGSVSGPLETGTVYTKPPSPGKMGPGPRLMGDHGEIAEGLLLETRDRSKPPDPPHHRSGIWSVIKRGTSNCRLLRLVVGEAAIHLKRGWPPGCRSGRKPKVQADKVPFHPADHASASFSELCSP